MTTGNLVDGIDVLACSTNLALVAWNISLYFTYFCVYIDRAPHAEAFFETRDHNSKEDNAMRCHALQKV